MRMSLSYLPVLLVLLPGGIAHDTGVPHPHPHPIESIHGPEECPGIADRERCLTNAFSGGHCAFCSVTEKCVPRKNSDCPKGCLFFDKKPQMNENGSSPTCHLLRGPRNQDEYDEEFALRMVLFSGAAYCNKSDIESWTCGGGKCVEGFQPNFVITDDEYELLAFGGIDKGTNQEPKIVLSIRGTVEHDYMNWIADMDIVKIAPYPNKDIRVHRGFHLAYLQLKETIFNFLKNAPKLPVVFTGHSLGAAIATLAAYDLASEPELMGFKSISAYTFGQPRVGNHAFHEDYAEKMHNVWRVTHHKDLIPKVPYQAFGYYHASREIWYHDEDFQKGQYKLCDGSGEDPECLNGFWFAYSVRDHLNYLGVSLGTGQC